MRLKPKIFFVATVEFTVNAFLLNHFRLLSDHFDLTLIVNTTDPDFLSKQGISARLIPMNIAREINIPLDLYCLLKLIVIFLKNKPSSLQSITPKAGLLAMLAGFIAFVPFRVHTFTGQVWVSKKGIARFILKSIDRFIGLLAHQCIVDSPSQRNFLIAQGVVSEKKSIVFGSGSVSGVDLDKFKFNQTSADEVRKDLAIPADAFIFMYLGRLSKDKGVMDLVSAFSRIASENVYLVMVGPEEADLTATITKEYANVMGKVRFVGLASEPERYLSAADTLCLPSYREGFGSVLIEAGAISIPVIASNIYGIQDAVIDRETGLLHAPKDVNAIAACMQLLLANSSLVLQLGSAARVRVVNEFDAKILSKCWLDFYMEHVG